MIARFRKDNTRHRASIRRIMLFLRNLKNWIKNTNNKITRKK